MIRRSQLSLKYMNQGKLASLDSFMVEAVRVVNIYIDLLWGTELTKFCSEKVETWLSARMQQCLSKQALEILKSQVKKAKERGKDGKKKPLVKPVFKKESITLDSRFFDVQDSEGCFDTWIRFTSLGNKLQVRVPTKKHEHFNEFIGGGWACNNSCRLRRVNGTFYVDLFFEKEAPPKKTEGKDLGFDSGYNQLLVDSEGTLHDKDLKSFYGVIEGKKKGSKGFQRALRHRDHLVHEVVRSIDLSEVKTVVVEALRNVKYKTGGRRKKEFNSKQQRWVYPKVLGALSSRCEREGIRYVEVPPFYTSQRCSLCGRVHGASRVGSLFSCTCCGMEMDADFNAAKNILYLGVIAPESEKRFYEVP